MNNVHQTKRISYLVIPIDICLCTLSLVKNLISYLSKQSRFIFMTLNTIPMEAPKTMRFPGDMSLANILVICDFKFSFRPKESIAPITTNTMIMYNQKFVVFTLCL